MPETGGYGSSAGWRRREKRRKLRLERAQQRANRDRAPTGNIEAGRRLERKEKQLKKNADQDNGCAVTAISVGISVAGVVAMWKGWV